MSVNAKGPGRPARIRRADIERAVLTLGFNDVTTTAVARHLGVDQSSLYRHISSLQELLRCAVDRATAEHPQEFSHGTWREYLAGIADNLWRLLIAYPGMAKTLYSLEERPPASMVRHIEESVEVLSGTYGWSVADALLILDSLSDMTMDTVNRAERMMVANAATTHDEAARHVLEHSELSSPVIRVLTNILDEGIYQWWRRKMDLLLDGAERLAP